MNVEARIIHLYLKHNIKSSKRMRKSNDPNRIQNTANSISL